jgi:CRP/FNR family transcriptional regulator
MEYFSIQELSLPQDIWAPFASHYDAAQFVPNQMIYFQESQADCFYYLKSGRVKTFISSEDGSEKVLTIYQAGNLFGEAAFFDELPRVSNAITLTQCEIVKINREMARREIAQSPELALALLKYLARTVRLLSGHVDDMAFLRTDQRIARYLLSVSRSADGSFSCTQDEIASAVSASRITVCRILSRMSKEGMLSTGYGSIRLLEPDALERLLENGA